MFFILVGCAEKQNHYASQKETYKPSAYTYAETPESTVIPTDELITPTKETAERPTTTTMLTPTPLHTQKPTVIPTETQGTVSTHKLTPLPTPTLPTPTLPTPTLPTPTPLTAPTKAPTTKPTTTKPSTTKLTTTAPTTQATTEATTKAKKYCTVRIECNTIYDNIGKLKSGKKAFLPASGVILDSVQVELTGGESAFDVIKKACEENVCTDNCKYCKSGGVQIEYTYTPAFNNYYIEGIHQIYEKDCGTQSGWMYSVNGIFPDVGSSSYAVSEGDVIVFAFTCNMGEDIDNSY